MNRSSNYSIGLGTYSPSEAASILNISRSCVRRWSRGYAYWYEGKRVSQPPIWQREHARSRAALELGFRDLMELRAIDAFHREGVHWPTIRRLHEVCAQRVGHSFPFSTGKFYVLGRQILAEGIDWGTAAGIVEPLTGQALFEIVRPLMRHVEFGRDRLPLRWWPMGERRQVVIDPARGFGRPIVKREGVPTHVLWDAVRAGDSRAMVSRWFEVSRESLDDALRYEQQRAA